MLRGQASLVAELRKCGFFNRTSHRCAPVRIMPAGDGTEMCLDTTAGAELSLWTVGNGAKAPAAGGVSGAGAGGMTGVSAVGPSPLSPGFCLSSLQKASKTSRASALRQLRNPAAHWIGESGAATVWTPGDSK